MNCCCFVRQQGASCWQAPWRGCGCGTVCYVFLFGSDLKVSFGFLTSIVNHFSCCPSRIGRFFFVKCFDHSHNHSVCRKKPCSLLQWNTSFQGTFLTFKFQPMLFVFFFEGMSSQIQSSTLIIFESGYRGKSPVALGNSMRCGSDEGLCGGHIMKSLPCMVNTGSHKLHWWFKPKDDLIWHFRDIFLAQLLDCCFST